VAYELAWLEDRTAHTYGRETSAASPEDIPQGNRDLARADAASQGGHKGFHKASPAAAGLTVR
jgi:hypothetical protein